MATISDTIFALATPVGRSAVAIVRVSGKKASEALKRMTIGAKGAGLATPREACYTEITTPDGTPIDKGLVIFFPSASSATGEDLTEFHLHGSPILIKLVLEGLGSIKGFRLAEAGEFTRRSFLNGKLSLEEAEAIGDMIDADTEAQHRQALGQLSGQLGEATEDWRAKIISLSAQLEALIDFADEDLPPKLEEQLGASLKMLIEAMGESLKTAKRGIITRDGIIAVLIGRPNAGKSTLLNVLAGDERAIVSHEAGTTRDLVEVHLDIGGVAVRLIDTAGLRSVSSGVESEGISRALAMASRASIVLLLIDSEESDPKSTYTALCEQIEDSKNKRIVAILSKADLLKNKKKTSLALPPDWLLVSAKTGEGMATLDALLEGELENHLAASSSEAPLLTRERHRQAVEAAKEALERAEAHNLGTSPELMAEEFRLAASALGRITGRVDIEDVLDEIFSSFCIGK